MLQRRGYPFFMSYMRFQQYRGVEQNGETTGGHMSESPADSELKWSHDGVFQEDIQ